MPFVGCILIKIIKIAEPASCRPRTLDWLARSCLDFPFYIGFLSAPLLAVATRLQPAPFPAPHHLAACGPTPRCTPAAVTETEAAPLHGDLLASCGSGPPGGPPSQLAPGCAFAAGVVQISTPRYAGRRAGGMAPCGIGGVVRAARPNKSQAQAC